MRNSLQKMAALLFCVSAVMADVSSLSKGYLPPDQSGYNYGAPSVSFSTPAPTYRPTPHPPIYSTPSYPTQPPYRPSYPTQKPPSYGGESGYAEGSQISPVSNPGAGLGGGEFDHLQQPHVPGMPFDFNYEVKDQYYGTDYGHQATSNGDQVRGEYRVVLPDGRLQIVKYVADWKDGYTAEVTYQGEAQYPTGPSSSGSGIGAGGYPAPIKPSPGYPKPSPGYPQPSPGYPQPSPGYPQPSPAYPSPSPAYPSPSPSYPSYPQPSPAYPSPSPSYPSFPQKPSSYPKPGSGSSFGGSQQVPVSTGYPSGVPSSGYPSGLPSGGYPSGLPSSGYPSSSPTAGYPSKPSSGYGQPSNFQQGSYGAPQPISGYGSSQQPTGGYSSPAPSYSSGPDYGGY